MAQFTNGNFRIFGPMLKKLISNAVLSLVMDKQAKQKLRSIRGGGGPILDPQGPENPVSSAAREGAPPGPDRKELIAQAMAIHQTKSAIFDDLTLNEKRQLQELAAKTLLGNLPSEKDG